MKAIGKKANGETVEFEVEDGKVSCSNNQFTELILPKGIEYVSCSNNQLTELILPKGVKYVCCYNNQLTELILPEGVEYVDCDPNVKKIYK